MELVNGIVMDKKIAFYLFIKMIKLLNVNVSTIKMKFIKGIRVGLLFLEMILLEFVLIATLIVILIQQILEHILNNLHYQLNIYLDIKTFKFKR